MICIGIDPGVTTGFCQVDTKNKTRFMKGLTFWQCIKNINYYKNVCIEQRTSMKVFVEDPNFNKPVFPKKGAGPQDVLFYIKIAQNVGQNKMMATLIIDYCKSVSIPVEALKPNPKGKVKGEAFEERTGIKTNQHCRDSFMILVNKNVIPFNKVGFFNIDKAL